MNKQQGIYNQMLLLKNKCTAQLKRSLGSKKACLRKPLREKQIFCYNFMHVHIQIVLGTVNAEL